MITLWGGIFLGGGMFLAKWCLYWLATGGEKEFRIRYWFGIWGPKVYIRERIKKSAILKVCVDTIFGYVGIHTLTLFGATNMALVAFCIYTMSCMTVLMWDHICNWFQKKFNIQRRRRWAHS